MQPLWGISVNGSDPDKQAQILPLVRKVLSDMVRSGLDKTLLTGALNRTEFALREADFVGRPKGLIYGIRCMDTWLYDMDPLAALSYEGALETLRRGIDNGYFEGLIQKYILDNPYYALVSLVPEPGLTERHDKALADKLAAYKASLSKEEIDAIVADSQALQKRQATPDSPEALETIPTLTRDDLEQKVDSIAMEQQTMDAILEITGNILAQSGIDQGLFQRSCRRLQEDISQDFESHGYGRVQGTSNSSAKMRAPVSEPLPPITTSASMPLRCMLS